MERYKLHGHYPALVVVEGNAALSMRLERALFDEHFEVLLLSGDTVSVSELESQYQAFHAAGLVVIYSCDKLGPEDKRKLTVLAEKRFFNSPAPQSSEAAPTALRKIVSDLQSLRAITADGDR
jgi:hypothetical protein